jgi:hypothetical protein
MIHSEGTTIKNLTLVCIDHRVSGENRQPVASHWKTCMQIYHVREGIYIYEHVLILTLKKGIYFKFICVYFLHATVLLAVKYSAELNKYVLLVRVICDKYRFRGQTNFSRRKVGSRNLPRLSTGIFRAWLYMLRFIATFLTNLAYNSLTT